MDDNIIPLGVSELKVLNKLPQGRPRTRCREQVREGRKACKERVDTDTRGVLMGG
jgi:hypothetical protein